MYMFLEYVDCDLCDGIEEKVKYVVKGFRIVQCRNCGLVYVNPRLKMTSAFLPNY